MLIQCSCNDSNAIWLSEFFCEMLKKCAQSSVHSMTMIIDLNLFVCVYTLCFVAKISFSCISSLLYHYFDERNGDSLKAAFYSTVFFCHTSTFSISQSPLRMKTMHCTLQTKQKNERNKEMHLVSIVNAFVFRCYFLKQLLHLHFISSCDCVLWVFFLSIFISLVMFFYISFDACRWCVHMSSLRWRCVQQFVCTFALAIVRVDGC